MKAFFKSAVVEIVAVVFIILLALFSWLVVRSSFASSLEERQEVASIDTVHGAAHGDRAVHAPAHDEIESALDAVPAETPISDLWVYDSGNVGVRVRVLDVFTPGKRTGTWASLRGEEPPFDSRDLARWNQCAKVAMREPAGISIICLDDDRLWSEVGGAN